MLLSVDRQLSTLSALSQLNLLLLPSVDPCLASAGLSLVVVGGESLSMTLLGTGKGRGRAPVLVAVAVAVAVVGL